MWTPVTRSVKAITYRQPISPVAYFSDAVIRSKESWNTTTKEAFAVVLAVCHWYVYLVGTNITLNTDHTDSGGFQILGPWAIFYMRSPACERREQLGVWGRCLGGGR